MSTLLIQEGKVVSGVRLHDEQLDNLFAPQQVEPFTPPPRGIDNLGISSTDTFHIPGKGDFTVDFRGFVRVARSVPTAADWVHAEVYTNLIEMKMLGYSPEIGQIIVVLNVEYVSTGMLRTPFECMSEQQPEKACRMAVGAVFQVPKLGMTLFNKEPIELTIDNVRAIPPAGSPGVGRIYRMLPLFDVNNPDNGPVAYLTALNFAMGTYLTEAELAAWRTSNPETIGKAAQTQ
ncbi:MAG: DUF6073 family protein [Candidatus Angelobacter sp.]